MLSDRSSVLFIIIFIDRSSRLLRDVVHGGFADLLRCGEEGRGGGWAGVWFVLLCVVSLYGGQRTRVRMDISCVL